MSEKDGEATPHYKPLVMYPSQAASCLKAAAKLLNASWRYDADGSWETPKELIRKALEITAIVQDNMGQYLENDQSA